LERIRRGRLAISPLLSWFSERAVESSESGGGGCAFFILVLAVGITLVFAMGVWFTLACPCGGRRAIVADISDSEVVVAILAHLGLPTEAPPMARARSPDFELA
jgi:hypothetical protein